MRLPTDMTASIVNQFSGIFQSNKLYSVDCALRGDGVVATESVTFNFGTISISIPASDLIIQLDVPDLGSDPTCYLALVKDDDYDHSPALPQRYTLGGAFLRSAVGEFNPPIRAKQTFKLTRTAQLCLIVTMKLSTWHSNRSVDS